MCLMVTFSGETLLKYEPALRPCVDSLGELKSIIDTENDLDFYENLARNGVQISHPDRHPAHHPDFNIGNLQEGFHLQMESKATPTQKVLS